MRGRAEEILVEGGSIRKVAKREEYSDVMARFRINNEEQEDTPEEGENQEKESDSEGGIYEWEYLEWMRGISNSWENERSANIQKTVVYSCFFQCIHAFSV